MIIIILGPQGSGKGTQAKLLAEKYKLFHLEAGKILREVSEGNSRIKKMIDNGILISEDEMLGFVKNELKSNKINIAKIIFDGYPRTLKQYVVYKNWLKEEGQKEDYVIYLDLSEKESIRRLSARRVCDKCGQIYNLLTNPPKTNSCDECGGKLVQRDDDKPETIKKRLALFNHETKPLLAIFDKLGILIKINGEKPIEEIFNDIVRKLSSSK
ncbi:MAG: Adenylate kinase [Candidatus Woesebacteria bacterium GW2011_GWA1_37_7]|uniref:Adenylate kinase n=2 Tax=Candidatus Woeseibacteriota TaxID=1752722 RepID=A0A0G0HFT5_9BACT|nr:MAG: Adenylate kinase [Candidatus Woesebacteria bacterium GW2011_GWA1_37_7]OGM18409.1 MAG: hypothetical protein A2685_01405 [Candidatus Woesebacteria bacterium RIFCSPHIGHO2_01_FULL_37_10]